MFNWRKPSNQGKIKQKTWSSVTYIFILLKLIWEQIPKGQEHSFRTNFYLWTIYFLFKKKKFKETTVMKKK